jgi:hypothetical protein
MATNIKIRLFQVVRSTAQNEAIVTNDVSRLSTQDVQKVIALRWKVEQFHREIKQTTGIQQCQCRNHRAWRTHIAVANLLWLRLNKVAHDMGKTIYNIKNTLLDEYMKVQLKAPNRRFA